MTAAAPVLSTEPEYAKIEKVERIRPALSDEELEQTYNLEKVADKIVHGEYRRVALQFPDGLLEDSTQVARILERKVEKDTKVYVLADTSYSPCCVDEVAAKHVNADVIVHFGNACLTPSKEIPVIYVIGDTSTVDVAQIAALFRQRFADKNAKVVLFAETQYTDHLKQLYETLKSEYANILLTLPVLQKEEIGVQQAAAAFVPPSEAPASFSSSLIPNRVHEGLDGETHDYELFYLTAKDPSSSLVLHISTLFADVAILDVSVASPSIASPPRALQRRYRYMNVARTASTIGILINTLSLRNTEQVLQKVKSWITGAGKKHYTFVVGKPNVPKLANFDVVDVWVVLGCGIGGIIVNCDDYYKPIITPYELNLALMSEVSWTGQWLIDFEAALGMSVDNDDSANGDDEDIDAPQFDAISGKYVSTSRPLRRLQHVDVSLDETQDTTGSDGDARDMKAIAQRMASDLVIRGTVSTAAEYIKSKSSWRGLGSDFDEVEIDKEGAQVKKGRSGIARGYAVGDVPKS